MIADQQDPRLVIPVPDKFALKLSEDLRLKIYEAIVENGGSISFEQYMQMALYEPGLGYYSAGSNKFGEAGDFVTAPEISPLFSRCIAKQCQQVLSEILSAGESSVCIFELGPGTGIMAIDILQELERNDAVPEIYYMLEPSADLRQRQQLNVRKTIPHLEERIIWLEHFPDKKINGVILANEVIDAMSVKRIVINDSIQEYVVACESDVDDHITFKWFRKSLGRDDKAIVETILDDLREELSENYITEFNFNIQPWIASLNDILDKGLILISDYGYPRREFFHPQRSAGTLICHYRHYVHDNPFLYPGLQDITASVDFTTVAEAAVETGLHVSGFTTQAHFLIACGLDQFVSEYDSDDVIVRTQMTHQVSQLTMPGEMGEKFKFIALNKSFDLQPCGFGFFDQRAHL